jgi:hypothetical protein
MLVRVLADGSLTLGTAGTAADGRVTADCGEGDKITARVDYTGWLGTDTLSSATWHDLDSATATGEATSGAVASALITIPGESGTTADGNADDQVYRFRVVAVSSGGRQHVTRAAFVARGR